MAATNHSSGRVAYRLGQSAARMWQWLVRGEQQAVDWIVGQGVSVGAAKALLWAVKLTILGVLLYVAL